MERTSNEDSTLSDVYPEREYSRDKADCIHAVFAPTMSERVDTSDIDSNATGSPFLLSGLGRYYTCVSIYMG